MQSNVLQSVFAWLTKEPGVAPVSSSNRITDPQLTGQCSQWLIALGMDHLARRVVVVWNSRMRSTAGRAWLKDSRIELNPRLKDLDAKHIDTTLRHELAHLIAFARAEGRRISAHGVEWRKACADLGIPDEKSCHRLPLPSRRQQIRYLYQCPQCRVEIPRVRRMKKPMACLRCCRDYASGRYDKRFRFLEKQPSSQ
ncbi:MAG: hypothetical protein RI957_1835 [Verrucomicrobiota bacterium]